MTTQKETPIYQSLTRVSISKNLEKKWLLIFSLARENWFFISLSILDFQDFLKKFYFSSRFVRFLKLFSFYSWFSRFLRKNSLSLLDWWDSETQISFSSRFSRFWEKNLFLFSIYEIFDNNSLSLLNFQDFYKQSIHLKGADNANRAIQSNVAMLSGGQNCN